MSRIVGSIVVDKERCKGCGVCLEVCKAKAIELSSSVNSKGYNFCQLVENHSCVGCSSCGVVCPDSCITVYRKKIE